MGEHCSKPKWKPAGLRAGGHFGYAAVEVGNHADGSMGRPHRNHSRGARNSRITAITVVRPIWRSFAIDEVDAAAAHVRGGGFSALVDNQRDIKLLLPRDRGGELTELAQWVLLALDLRNWGYARSGPAQGLAAVWVERGDRDIVEGWCTRDERLDPYTQRMELDCLACGACCRDSRVVIEPGDRATWRRAGRPELEGRVYLRTSQGELVLKHAPSGACVHFGEGNRCAIYDIRPFNCSVFPVGSEPCLTVRAGILGLDV